MKRSLLLLMASAFFTGAYAQTSLCFKTPVSYTLNGAPNDIATADFNGDGRADLASVNTDNTAAVSLNVGGGTFGTIVTYSVGNDPVAIATGDFNGDGTPDLVTANALDNNVSVLINNGSGAFAAAVNYPSGSTPYGVAVADFDGDGKPDLAATNANGNNVVVLINNGNGTFGTGVPYPVGSVPYGITSADFDGDGTADLAATNYGTNNISVLLNNGDGTFGAGSVYTVGGSPNYITTADLDGNGSADLVVTNPGFNTFTSLLNSGSGTFAASPDFMTGSNPQKVNATDLDGNGVADLIIANFNDNTLSVFQGSGGGGFYPPTTYTVVNAPYAITSADFNGDGKVDMASGNYNYNISILEQCTQPGAALNFDGVDDYFASATSSTLAMVNEATIEAWFRTNSDGEIIRLNTPSDEGMEAGLSGGQFYFNAYLGSWNNFAWSTGPMLNDGNWHHFAMVAGGNMAWAYVDGALAGSITGSASLNTGNASVHVGSHPALISFFTGNIDEVRVWNRALCLPEIQNNMSSELMLPQSGLVAYYRLDQGDALSDNSNITSATDSSGNGMDGTLNNFALTGSSSNWIASGAVTSGAYTPAYVLPTACITTDTSICENDTLKLSTCGGAMDSYAWFGPGGFFASTDSTNIPQATSANSGIYTLVVSDANGCNGNASVNITVNPYPVLLSQSGPVNVCGDVAGTFTVNSTGGSSYQWFWYPLNDTTNITIDYGAYGETGYNTDSLTIPNLVSEGWDGYGVFCVITNGACSILSVGDSIHAYDPAVLASVTSATLCSGFSDTLLVTGADTYTWSANAGNTTNDTAYVSPTSSDMYIVTGTDIHGCSNADTVSITVITCSTGLKQNGGINFNVYPNPNNGYFTVESTTGETEEIKLYDINGRLVISRSFAGKTTIDASGLTNGTYNLNISSSAGIFNKRVVINK